MEENWEAKNSDLEHLKDWVQNQPHLPEEISEQMLELFLFSCYSDMAVTKKAIATYYSMKASTPEFFSNRDLDHKLLKHITNVVQICVLPERTKDGFAVIWSRIINTEASKFVLDNCIKLLFMVVDTALRCDHTNVKGLLFVYDNQGNSLSHLARVSLSSVKKYFTYVQDGMPIRLRGVHIINISPVITHVMTLIKPFLGKEQAKRITMYNPDRLCDLEHIVPKKSIPSDYGGEGASMDSLFNETVKKIRANSEWFHDEDTTLEELASLSNSNKKNTTFTTQSSFKKLSID